MTEVHVVYSDPPWNETGGGRIKRGADRHYSLIKKKEHIRDAMMGAPEWKMLAENVHHYMWVTNNFLPDGLWLMDALGFRYITNIAWTKKRFGIGRYFRGQHELLLFGVKGNGFAPDVRTAPNNIRSTAETEHTLLDAYLDAIDLLFSQRSLPEWKPEMDRGLLSWLEDSWRKLDAAEQGYVASQGCYWHWVDGEMTMGGSDVRGGSVAADHIYLENGQRKHSAKPPVFYELIESRSKGPYLEMFARSGRPGWTSWGNEAPEAPPAPEPSPVPATYEPSSRREQLGFFSGSTAGDDHED